MDLSVVPYQQQQRIMKSENENIIDDSNNNDANNLVGEPVVMNPKAVKAVKTVKYKECMRNHAASIGGHANDGCGEFMSRGGGSESRDLLTCAACGCHRNFHRREMLGVSQPHLDQYPLHSPPSHPHPLPSPTTPSVLLYNASPTAMARNPVHLYPHHHHHHNHNHGGDRRSETPEREVGEVGVGSSAAMMRNKRYRTKFTQEQKDKMLEFAERIGWRIQRHDDVALNQFCSEVGIKRNVLKVWMHNNKLAHRRRESAPHSPLTPTPTPTLPPPPPPPPPPPQPQPQPQPAGL